jgi:hypothetical protein
MKKILGALAVLLGVSQLFAQNIPPIQSGDIIIIGGQLFDGVRDTLTLWHLLSRVEASDRVRVYERIAQFEPPPSGATRERILALDADALRRWREELAWKW